MKTLGSAPPDVSTQPVSAVVVVLPCVPAMTMGLGERHVSNLPIQHRLQLGVAARDGIAHDDEIEVRIDAGRVVPLEDRDLLGGEELAHRRIHVLIGALHVDAAMLEQRGQRGHCRAADPDQVCARHLRSPRSRR
jgi:hypothetical protein